MQRCAAQLLFICFDQYQCFEKYNAKSSTEIDFFDISILRFCCGSDLLTWLLNAASKRKQFIAVQSFHSDGCWSQ